MTHARTFTRVGLIVTLFVATALPVFAQSVTGKIGEGLKKAATESGFVSGASTTDLPTIIGRVIGVALTLLGTLLLAYILYGGFLWMTAGGEEKNVTKAKDIIKNAVIGLTIIVAAYALSTFVIKQLNYVLEGTTGPKSKG
ncbi:MAG: hypothetical protein AAB879_02165 [Patescibacteria group bacterium]